MSPSEPPAIPVLAAVIRRGNHVLLGRRPAGTRHAGLWEFPGGKLEPGESWTGAATRELREELGVEVARVGTPLRRHQDPGSRFEIVFADVEIRGEPRPLEHDELRWVRTEELSALPMPPADAAFVDWLAGRR